MAILLSLAILPGGVRAEGSGVPEGRGASLDYTAADSYRAYLKNHSGDARAPMTCSWGPTPCPLIRRM